MDGEHRRTNGMVLWWLLNVAQYRWYCISLKKTIHIGQLWQYMYSGTFRDGYVACASMCISDMCMYIQIDRWPSLYMYNTSEQVGTWHLFFLVFGWFPTTLSSNQIMYHQRERTKSLLNGGDPSVSYRCSLQRDHWISSQKSLKPIPWLLAILLDHRHADHCFTTVFTKLCVDWNNIYVVCCTHECKPCWDSLI